MPPKSTLALAIACTCLLAPTGVIAGEGGVAGMVPIETTRVASGLNRPVFVTHAPNDEDRLFIVEQRGVIKILDLTTGTVLGTPFLDIDVLVFGPSNDGDERGLFRLAFHPDYDNPGFLYVNFIGSGGTNVRRYEVSGNPNVADSTSGATIMTFFQPFSNHNGGWMGFGPNDGFLYISTGDGGSACDPSQRAQDITNQLLGKMLRIIPSKDPDGSGYSIPFSNPFVNETGDDEIWAYGLRNPWRPSFDRETGDLYIADVGQNRREEVDFQPASSQGGENYGWDCKEGTECSSISPQCVGFPVGCNCQDNSLIDPIHQYTNPTNGRSITGGYAYRGCDLPDWDGTYFFADFVSARIWSFDYDGNVNNFAERTSDLSPSSEGAFVRSISSFGEDARGEIYIVDRGINGVNGEVFKIVPVAPCPWDLNGDGTVGVGDMLALFAVWGPCPNGPCCTGDFDGNGAVGVGDLLAMFANWGPCP